MGKAKQCIDQSKTTLENTISTLRNAMNEAEKNENKQRIQCAIDSVNHACDELCKYQD